MPTALELDVPAGSLLIDSVRELAREGRLPLYWRCGQGTCGACLVYLQHAQQPGEVAMNGKERNVLARKGLLSEAERLAVSLPDTTELPRLACHIHLCEGTIKVRW